MKLEFRDLWRWEGEIPLSMRRASFRANVGKWRLFSGSAIQNRCALISLGDFLVELPR
ncbi:MAG: hypothetical protein JWM99_1864 [Verrucomicrobiales bacterium]|nr:hypothetical protein [Verrucomicrobiales bacterium]